MAIDPRLLALLRALEPGRRMWLSSGGRSMWPLIVHGDRLCVERVGPHGVREGDVAVLCFGEGLVVAHLVTCAAPLRTVSSVGVVDPPGAELLGRVVALRRGALRLPWPRALSRALRHLPALAALSKRLPLARRLVRALRD